MNVLIRPIVFALAVSPPLSAAAAEGWPGLPPDCWTEPRMVHSLQDPGVRWQDNIRITERRAGKPPAAQLSPNKGYAFAVEGSRPTARVTIYAEKDYVVDIDFVELSGLGDVRWLNEKLVFMRAWWGRIAATDLIFDVERERFVYAEALTDGSLAFQQYRESCPLHGCGCIKKSK
jgi:hypothetical protein